MAVEFWRIRPVLQEGRIGEVRFHRPEVQGEGELVARYPEVPDLFRGSVKGVPAMCIVDDNNEFWNPSLRKRTSEICSELHVGDFVSVFVHAQALGRFFDAKLIIDALNAVGIRFALYWIDVYDDLMRDLDEPGYYPGLPLLSLLADHQSSYLPEDRGTEESIFPLSGIGDAESDVNKYLAPLPIGGIISKWSWQTPLRNQLNRLKWGGHLGGGA